MAHRGQACYSVERRDDGSAVFLNADGADVLVWRGRFPRYGPPGGLAGRQRVQLAIAPREQPAIRLFRERPDVFKWRCWSKGRNGAVGLHDGQGQLATDEDAAIAQGEKGMLAPLWSYAGEPVRIALNIPLTGAFANIGELFVQSAQFAVDAANARGGVLEGRRLEILPFDNRSDPQQALLVFRQITDRHIPFMIQDGGSHIAVPLAEAVAKHNARETDNRLLFLNQPGDQALTNEQCNFWTFMFMANTETKMEALTTHLASDAAIRRVYLINQDYAFGHQIRNYARAMLARKRPDIKIVGDDLHPMGKVKDFAPYVTKIKASRADAVITGNWGPDIALLIRAASDQALSVGFYTYYAIGPGAPTAIGMAGAERVHVIWRWHPNLPIEIERKAADAYKQRFRHEYYAMPTNNLIAMLTRAIDKAGSTDAVRVAYAFEDMRVHGSMGEVWMRPADHQLFEPLYIFRFTPVDGRDVRYGMEETGIGTRTEARIEAEQMALPTSCRMQRPPRPRGFAPRSGKQQPSAMPVGVRFASWYFPALP